MTLKNAEQNQLDSDKGNVRVYEIPELEDNYDLIGIIFNLPYSPESSPTQPQPTLTIYSDGDVTGCFFNGESFIHETVSGIEDRDIEEILGSEDYSFTEVNPFLGRKDDLKEGFRKYRIPTDAETEYELLVDMKPDNQRSRENIRLTAYRNNKNVFNLFLGRTKDNWTFIQEKQLDSAEEA